MSSQGSDFADEIIQDELPKHTVPPRDQFLPWHRVRKEFIRQNQWNDLIAQMIKRYWCRQLQGQEGNWSMDETSGAEEKIEIPANVALDRPLSCLVIPGEDLLDVRALWRDVNELKCFIRYLGFNEGQGSNLTGTRIHVANNSVTSLPRVSRDSLVLHDRFEAIASEQSQALRYLKEYGPYHVVNLDLCGSMFPNNEKDPGEYYGALYRLLAYQFEHQKTEWLLFITTVVKPACVHPDSLQTLCKPTRENYKKHADFAEKLKTFLPEDAFGNIDQLVNLSALQGHQMIQLFGVALGKWLLALCQNAQPQWTIAMRKSFRYVISEHDGAVMLSLAFALKPNITPPVDASGMANLVLPTRQFPDERTCAIKLADSVSKIRDVDEALVANPALKTKLRDSQADLLEASGYDRSAYVKWVDDGEVATSG